MIYLTQLVYLVAGEEAAFDEFESVALPAIPKYNGQLLFRLRPSEKDYLELSIEQPYEVHFVQFREEADFLNYMQDEERKRFLHLKEKAIRSVILVKGQKL